jgi:hypothetical protein
VKDFWRKPLAKGDKAVRGANADWVIRPNDSRTRANIKSELDVAVVQAKGHKVPATSFVLPIVKDQTWNSKATSSDFIDYSAFSHMYMSHPPFNPSTCGGIELHDACAVCTNYILRTTLLFPSHMGVQK